jgi:hypothetical protein
MPAYAPLPLAHTAGMDDDIPVVVRMRIECASRGQPSQGAALCSVEVRQEMSSLLRHPKGKAPLRGAAGAARSLLPVLGLGADHRPGTAATAHQGAVFRRTRGSPKGCRGI